MKTVGVRAALAAFLVLAASASPLASCAAGVLGETAEPDGGGPPSEDSDAAGEAGDATSMGRDGSPAPDAPGNVFDAGADSSTPDDAATETGAADATLDATAAADAPLDATGAADAPLDATGATDAADSGAADAADGAIPATGLVGQWLCSGDTSDTSDSGNTGTNTSVTFVTDRHGVAGAACSFNGTSSFISVQSAANLDVTATWSLSAWVQPSSFSVLAGIASKYHSVNADGPTVRLSYNTPFSGIDVDEATNVADAATGLLSVGTWSHVGVTVNGTAVLCYVNGALAYSGTAGYEAKSNTDSFDIGLDYTNRFFAGAIDDVRFYNRVLSAAEIEALYLAP